MAYGIQDTVGMLDIPGRIAAEQAAEAETMTNPVDQLGSFINYLMSMVGLGNGVPQQQVDGGAHDSIDRVIDENNQIDTLKLLQSEYNLPGGGNIDLDSLLAADTPRWLKGPGDVPENNMLNSLIESLMRSQGEFGAAQPVSPHIMPR